jgi:hypothetical protein
MMTDSQLPPVPPTEPPAQPAAPPVENTAGLRPVLVEKRGNGLGLAALIVGVIALVGAFIPVVNLVTGFIAFVGLVLGVVALFLKGRSRKLAVAGAIVSLVALILSIVLSITYAAGLVAAIDNAGVDVAEAPAVSEEPETEADADADLGTRDNPYPLGTSLSFTEAGAPFYDVTVGASTLNANDIIAGANMFNEAPPAGTQFAMLPLTLTYTGAETGTPWIDISVEFIAADGTAHTTTDVLAVGPAPLTDLNDLYTGGSGTGNVVINVPSADVEKGTWLVKVGLITGEDTFFMAQ